jgi:Protein of unknown function (DUF3631)
MSRPSVDEVITLATRVWGPPTSRTAREVRFGTNGSKSLHLDDLKWYDHEDQVGGGYVKLRNLLKVLKPNGTAHPTKAKPEKIKYGPEIAAFVYRYADGSPAMRKARFHPPELPPDEFGKPAKLFAQSRPDGIGGWRSGIRGIEVPLWDLPELIAADADAIVYIPEGEAKADALQVWGLVATYAKPFLARHAQQLAGRTCMVMPDNDQAGRRHIEKVVQELRLAGAYPLILDLPDLPPKGDIVNWIDAGHTPEEFAALVEALLAAPPEPKRVTEPSSSADDGTPEPTTGEEVAAEVERLAALSKVAYDRVRVQRAKDLGVRISTLDKMVEDLRIADAKARAAAEAEARAKDQQEAGPEPSSISDEEIAAEIARAAALPRPRYEQQRERIAKALGMRAGALDDEVKKLWGEESIDLQGEAVTFETVEPWPENVMGIEMLDSAAKFYAAHVVLPPGAADAMALWSAHCHCFQLFAFTPRLHFKARHHNSGKSTAMSLVRRVVPKQFSTVTVSSAFLFRVINRDKPTFMLDEIDTYLPGNEDLRGILNGGVTAGGGVGRCVGDNQEPRWFRCHCPVALAGIGDMPVTIEDRAIRINMKRRMPDEEMREIDEATDRRGLELHRKMVRWTVDNIEALREAQPVMEGLINRAADRWRALYAVAQVAGGDWPRRAQEAMRALTDVKDVQTSLGITLLEDIRLAFHDWFDEQNENRIAKPSVDLTSHDLVTRLNAMLGHPWAELPDSRPPRALTQPHLAQMLREQFEIEPRRNIGPQRLKGYRMTDFTPAFDRYLAPFVRVKNYDDED